MRDIRALDAGEECLQFAPCYETVWFNVAAPESVTVTHFSANYINQDGYKQQVE